MNKLNFLVLVLLIFSCQKSSKEEKNKTEMMDVNVIHEGPIIRDSLTKNQIKDIEYLYETFKEVDPTSLDVWMSDFKRDQNPDREIEIWMMMANAYTQYCQKNKLDLNVKKEVYQIVLLRSSMSETDVLKTVKLKYLKTDDVNQIMKAYTLEAKPIRVVSKP